MCPASEFARFWTQYIRNCGVYVHEPCRNDEAEQEEPPTDPEESPEHVCASETLLPEVFYIEPRQRIKGAKSDESAHCPEEVRLESTIPIPPPIIAASISEDTPYKGNDYEADTKQELCNCEIHCHLKTLLIYIIIT